MKNILKYTLVALMGSTLGLTSCGLDEYNPSAGDETIESFDVWKGLATYCYTPLTTELFRAYDLMSMAEGGTDMWLCPGGNPRYAPEMIYYEGITTNTNAVKKVFAQAYTAIASCNSVVANADKLRGGSQDEIDKIVAEAKTLRAFYNLLLVTYYGPVTLTTQEVGGGVALSPTRNTVEEFYKSITTDLQEAAAALNNTPVDNNYARCTKKTALGLLARAYAQGAGEGLTEDGKSYWQRAREVAEDIIQHKNEYNVYLYDNIDDLWAQDNNRNNKEALFLASGANTVDPEMVNYKIKQNLFTYTFCDPNKLNDLYTCQKGSNYYLGKVSNITLAPSQYTIGVFDPSWDRRWENTFMTAYGLFSITDPNSTLSIGPYAGPNSCVTLNPRLTEKYGINSKFNGKKIYPYVDITKVDGGAFAQYVPDGIWPKGVTTGNRNELIQVKNSYVIDYPVALDDNRFVVVLSKEARTAEEKAQSMYFTVNIDDLFGDGEYSTEYKKATFDETNSYQLFPSMIKYNWNYNGGWGQALDQKSGDVIIMRTAEVYLIAAEACQQLNDPTAAANYLKPLRDRAVRKGATAPALGTVTEDVILDEWAREMACEYNRWALLKRHHAFEARLPKYNKRAAAFFDPSKHYNRPISADFLNQINNKDQYGDNGYGTTPGKGF